MNSEPSKRTVWALLVTVLTIAIPLAQAAKPADKGGGGSTTEAAAIDPPQFYWSSFDYVQRTLTIQGKDLITDDGGTTIFPQVYIGGELVLIDPDASAAATDIVTNEGPLLVPLDNILEALKGPASPPILRTIEGGDSWEIKAVTSTATALFSAYFPRTIKDIPPDLGGGCPCAGEFGVYDKVDVAPDATFCSATQGISTDEYIEAGYGRGNGTAVIIGSHRSWSSEPLYTSTCYARELSQVVGGEEQPQYLGSSPIPVGDGDHADCVALIMSIEAACSP
jgi:hypothetical protein